MLTLTTSEYDSLQNKKVGLCLYCNELQYNIEPDAKAVMCEECGQNQVMGLERVLVEDRMILVEE